MLTRLVTALALVLCAGGVGIYRIGWWIFDRGAASSLRVAHAGVVLWYVVIVSAGSILFIEATYYSLYYSFVLITAVANTWAPR